jgi:hypothetical protein
MRPYFKEFVNAGASPPGGWSTGPSQSSAESGNRLENWMNFRQPGWRQERIIEVTRENRTRTGNDGKEHTSVFVLKVYNSKVSDELLQTTYIYDNSINSNLLVGNPVYAGIALLGTSVEFSEMSLWDNANKSGEPIFKTPETTPAYVAVDSVTIRANRVGSSAILPLENHPTLSGASRTAVLPLGSIPNGLELTPVFLPTYADNKYFTWKLVVPSGTDDLSENITLEPLGEIEGTGWEKAKVQITEAGSYYIMATSHDAGLADWILEIRVR